MEGFEYVSCTSQYSSLKDFSRATVECWRAPGAATLLGRPHVLLISTLTYWAVLLALRVGLRGKRASIANTSLFVGVAVLHNILLALASLVMNVQISLAILVEWRETGFAGTVCTPQDRPVPHSMQLALCVFLATKIWEYADTVLLVLRGRSVSLLHLWHHSSVAWEVRGWLEYGMTFGVYGMWFNTVVHIFMYTYYACALSKLPFPFKRAITATQIVQFMTGFIFIIPYLILDRMGAGCHGKPAVLMSGLINGSYLILFIRFYRSAYKAKES
eukprot:IDg1429t1